MHWNMVINDRWLPFLLFLNIHVVAFRGTLLHHVNVTVLWGTCITYPVAPTTTPVTFPWTRVAVRASSVCVLSFYNFLSFYVSNTVTIHSVSSFFHFFVCLFAFSLLVGAGNTADVSCDNTLLTRLTILTGLCQHIQFINMAQTPPSCSDAFFWARWGQHGDHST